MNRLLRQLRHIKRTSGAVNRAVPPRKRLIGLWKSDRKRTLETHHRYHCLPVDKKRQVAGIFGHLELRYTRKYVYSNLREFRSRSRYEVLAEDSESIVIRVHYSESLKRQMQKAIGPGFEEFYEPRVRQITFRQVRGRQYYWIGLGTFCEWFRKQTR